MLSHMRNYVIFPALILITAGCDFSGERFISASKQSVALAEHEGQLWRIPGNPVLSDGTTGPQESLLHVLIVCPGMTGITNRGSEWSFAPGHDRYALMWGTPTGEVSVAVSWDKRADLVTVSGASYGRATGNVFVIKRDQSGRLVTTQLPSLAPNARPIDAVRSIRQRMSNDSVIASVRLLEGE
jgi:hypothetical protein